MDNKYTLLKSWVFIQILGILTELNTKFLVVKNREPLVDTSNKSSDRWGFILVAIFLSHSKHWFFWRLFVVSRECYPLFIFSRRNFLEFPWKSFDHATFSFWCSRSLVVRKMHLHLRRLLQQIFCGHYIPNNKQTKFIQQSWKGGNRDVVAWYKESCYIRKYATRVPACPHTTYDVIFRYHIM